MRDIVLFIPIQIENLVYNFFASHGIINAALSTLCFSLIFQLLMTPLTVATALVSDKKKRAVQSKKSTPWGLILGITRFVLSIVALWAVYAQPDTITVLQGLSEEEMIEVFSIPFLKMDLTEWGFYPTITMVIPVIYFLVATIPGIFEKKKIEKKEREEFVRDLSPEDLALYEEEEKKAKKMTVGRFFLKIAPLYTLIIGLIVPRYIALFWACESMWRYIINKMIAKPYRRLRDQRQQKEHERIETLLLVNELDALEEQEEQAKYENS